MTPRLLKIGSAIRRARRRAGLSQQDLADRVCVSRVSISNIENGKNSMQAQRLEDFAEALGIEAAELLGGQLGPGRTADEIIDLENRVIELEAELLQAQKLIDRQDRMLHRIAYQIRNWKSQGEESDAGASER